MKFEKAKTILQINVDEAGKQMPPDTLDAVKLGIKALDYCQNVKRFPHNADNIPLPSESPQDDPPYKSTRVG